MKNYTNTGIVHAFSQRNETKGKANSMFFDGNKIYSFGYHYLLAEFIEHNGETFILINNKGYSNTTAKHISLITQATRQYKQYFTTNVDFQLVYNDILSNYEKLAKAKKPLFYIEQIKYKFVQLTSYPLFNERYYPLEKFKEIYEIYKQVCVIDISELREIIKDKEKQKDSKKVRDFLNFETNYLKRDFDILRLNGENIETSQGVKVSKLLVKNLYDRLLNNLDIIGQKVDNYTIISNNNGVIQIGCHKIKLSENQNLLKLL